MQQGGEPPLDPKSDQPDAQTEATERFNGDGEAQTLLANTYRLDQVSAEDFDAVFYPGGHGPLWDLVNNPTSIALIESFVKADKPVGAVCHAPAALTEVRGKDGEIEQREFTTYRSHHGPIVREADGQFVTQRKGKTRHEKGLRQDDINIKQHANCQEKETQQNRAERINIRL